MPLKDPEKKADQKKRLVEVEKKKQEGGDKALYSDKPQAYFVELLKSLTRSTGLDWRSMFTNEAVQALVHARCPPELMPKVIDAWKDEMAKAKDTSAVKPPAPEDKPEEAKPAEKKAVEDTVKKVADPLKKSAAQV